VATASEQEEGTLSVKWMQENVKGQPVTALSTGIQRGAESFAMWYAGWAMHGTEP